MAVEGRAENCSSRTQQLVGIGSWFDGTESRAQRQVTSRRRRERQLDGGQVSRWLAVEGGTENCSSSSQQLVGRRSRVTGYASHAHATQPHTTPVTRDKAVMRREHPPGRSAKTRGCDDDPTIARRCGVKISLPARASRQNTRRIRPGMRAEILTSIAETAGGARDRNRGLAEKGRQQSSVSAHSHRRAS